MVEVRFASGELHGRCGTKRQRAATFGADTAHALAVRLAQLAVVASMADLKVIPCLSVSDGDGRLLIEVDDQLSLLVHPVTGPSRRLEALEISAIVFKGKRHR